MEVLIKGRICRQKLLQIRPGVGSGIVDGKAGSSQAGTTGISRNNNPMLATISISRTKQHRLSLL